MQNPVQSASSPSQPDLRPVHAQQPPVRPAHQATTVSYAQTLSKREPRFPHEKEFATAGQHASTMDVTHIEHSAAMDSLTAHVLTDPQATATQRSDAHTPRSPGFDEEAVDEDHGRQPAHGSVDQSQAWVLAQAHSSWLTLNPSMLTLTSADISAEAPIRAELEHSSAPVGASAAGGWTGVSWSWLGLLAAGMGYRVVAHHGDPDADTVSAQEPGLAFTLSGGLLAGPIINPSLVVTAYDANGQVLGTTTTHQDNQTGAGGYGYYTLTINHPGFSGGAVLLRVSDPTAGSGDDYIDEATGLPVDVTDLRAVVIVERPQNSSTRTSTSTTSTSTSLDANALQVTAHITPLTTLAAELIAPLPQTTGGGWTLPTGTTQAQITQSHQKVAELFGLSSTPDLTAVQPVAVISRDGTPLAGSNAYGKALAVLSLAQSQNTALSVPALAADLRSDEGADGPLKFSAAVASQFQQASLQAVAKRYLSTADAFDVQQATTAGTSTQAIDFQFERAALTLAQLDPADALGQVVYRITPVTTFADPAHPMPANGLRVYNVNTTDPARFRLELLDTEAGPGDAAAFTWNPEARTLVLNSETAPQVQGATGRTYHVTLRATADLLATPDNPDDDIAITQALTLAVKDTTPPLVASGYTITFNAIPGVQTQGSGAIVTTVGTPGIQNPEGFLTLSNLVPPDEPGVRYQVDLTLRNRASRHEVTRHWSNWFDTPASTRQLVLGPEEVSRLGNGTIDVQASVTATDRADLMANPVLSNTSFVLDTVVSTPTLSMLNYPASSISGDGWIRLAGLEPGASYGYTVFKGLDSISGGVVSSQAQTAYQADPATDPGTVALDFHALGSGDYTLQVTQQDAVGNQSSTTQSFTLDLEAPTGVDASIDAFEFTGASTDPRLFYLNGDDVGALSGTWKGHLEDDETLQLGVGRREPDGTVTWQWSGSLFNLLEPDVTGGRSWNFDTNQVAHWRVDLPPTVSGGSLLGLRLVDSLGHTNLLTTRDYIYQTQDVLLPPSVRWSDVSLDPQETTDTTLKVVVTGLAAHAQAQYLLNRSPIAPLSSDSSWSTSLPQPTPDGNSSDRWYLHVRQRDLLTQQVSASGDPLVIHLDTESPAPVTALLYQPLDDSSAVESTLAVINRDQVTRQSEMLVVDGIDDNGQPVFQGQVVSVLGHWTAADEGATLSVQWGHVLKTHILSLDDIAARKVDVWWRPDDILNQPGEVTVRAWVTDLSGNTSTDHTRHFVVDSRQTPSASAPTASSFLGLFTHASTAAPYGADTDYTLNKAEVLSGVQLRVQLGLHQADGSAVNWSKGFKLMLYAKPAVSSGNWSGTPVTTGTWSTVSSNSDMAWNAATGQVDWTLNLNNPLGNSLFSNMQGDLRDWKVQILNFAYDFSSPLYLSETPLAEVKVDTVSPGSLASTSAGSLALSLVSDGQRSVSLGQNQMVLPVRVNYAGMAAGDVLEFQSRPSDATAATPVFRYQVKAGDITDNQAVLSLARDTITQHLGDGVYALDLRVTDTAGNSTQLAHPTMVTVDTQGPSKPTLSWLAADPQQPFLNDGYLNARESTIDLNITWPTDHADTNTLRWVLGGTDLDDTWVSQFIRVKQVVTQAGVTTTTYTLDKQVFGSLEFDGVKTLRVSLTDAFGNRGAYADPLDLVLDSQPHDAPVLSVPLATNQEASAVPPRFLRQGAQINLHISDAQSVAGDTLHLVVTPAGEGLVPWEQDLPITHPLPTTLSLSQTGTWSFEGQTVSMSSLTGTSGLASGDYWVTATVTDLAGNVSRVSQPYQVVIDLDAPTNKALAESFVFGQHAVVDASATPGHHRAFITRVADQTITVQLDAALQDASSPTGAESLWGRVVTPGSTIDAATADDGWVDLSSAVAGSTLTWHTGTSGLALPSGVNVIQLQVRDAAGNRGALTEQTYVLDTTAPTTEIRAGTLTFSQDSEPTRGQGTPAALGLDHDLQTRHTAQTLRLDLSAALATDTNDSPTRGAAQEALWASLDNGMNWFDVTGFVSDKHLTWDLAQTRNPVNGVLSPLTLTQSSTARFVVLDVAGNRGREWTQAYVLDTVAPSTQATSVQLVSDTGLGDAEAQSHHDFITNQARTSLNLSFNQALSAGDRVYVSLDGGAMESGVPAQPYDITADLTQQGAFNAAAWGSSSPVFNVGSDTSGDANTPFILLSGSHTLSVWVEDRVGNRGVVLEQPYVVAAQPPALDLDRQGAGTDSLRLVTATQAQQGVSLGNVITVTAPSTDVADVVVRASTVNSDNGSNERLLIAPGVDIDLNRAVSTALQGLHLPGIDGTVQWIPYGGGEMHFAKQDASGQVAYFSASEVQTLLEGLRYFNTANSDDITPGTRSFSVQLLDRATNLSATATATLRVMAADAASMSTTANAGDNAIVGTPGDDLLFGLQGQDRLTGNGGNNTFLWLSGDATSTTRNPVTDVITDFHAWNASTQTGDRLDITRLLEGYSTSSHLAGYVTVDNRATVNGVANSTRLTVQVDGTSAGAVQIIELPGVALGTAGASTATLLQELMANQQLKVI